MSNVSTSSPVAAEWPLPNNGLSLAQMALATSLFVVLYTVVYMAGRAYFPREKTREKAWLLTTISSTGTLSAQTRKEERKRGAHSRPHVRH